MFVSQLLHKSLKIILHLFLFVLIFEIFNYLNLVFKKDVLWS